MRENFVPTPLSCAYINQLKSLNELFMKQNACKAHTQSHTHTHIYTGSHICTPCVRRTTNKLRKMPQSSWIIFLLKGSCALQRKGSGRWLKSFFFGCVLLAGGVRSFVAIGL